MPRRPPSPCPEPGCPALVDGGGRCPQHKRPAWTRTTPATPLPRNWPSIKRRILRRDHWRCYLCGHPAAEVDHKQPRSDGGSNDDANLAAICEPCHRKKTAAEGHRARARRRRGVG